MAKLLQVQKQGLTLKEFNLAVCRYTLQSGFLVITFNTSGFATIIPAQSFDILEIFDTGEENDSE